MRDDLWSPSVVFNFGRLFCYDTDSTLDYNDLDDGLVIKNAATLVRYTHLRNRSDCIVATLRIAVGFQVTVLWQVTPCGLVEMYTGLTVLPRILNTGFFIFPYLSKRTSIPCIAI